jgi:hypothetical protein
METSILLKTPLAIEEYINQEFPDFSVQVDPDRQEIHVLIPDSLGLPAGKEVIISTVVFKRSLTEAIISVAEDAFSPRDATEALRTATPLSRWEETRIILQRRAEPEHPWWSPIASWISQGARAIGKAVAPIASIGGSSPPNAQTIVVALQVITAVGACIAKTFSTAAGGLSALLRVANILVLAGRCENPSLSFATRFAPTDLTIYLLSIPLLLLPAPWGVLVSGALASFPEFASWVRKFRYGDDPSPIAFLTQGMPDPTDPEVAREVFGVSEGDELDQTSVDQFYDWRYRDLIDRMARARERGQTLVVEFGCVNLQFLNRAYLTLTGHPRSTGVD